jgi:hypothetical protein
MAARFPQSGSPVAYRIKSAWSSKIKAIFWAVAADKVHMLRSGDTASTVITRSAGGAGYDATNGRITGNTTTYFQYEQSGGFGGLKENDNFCFGVSCYGDLWAGGISEIRPITSALPSDSFANGFKAVFTGGSAWNLAGGSGNTYGGAFANNVDDWMTVCIRHDQADATATFRGWLNGSELVALQTAVSKPSKTDVIAATGRPLYFGASVTGNSPSHVDFEACWIAGVLTDAEMATITSDPSSIIEVSSPSIALSPKPTTAVVSGTRTFTITRTTAAPAGGVTYNLASSTPAVATVPASVVMAEGTTTKTFDATGESVGSTNISATNAADSGETDTAALTVSAPTTTTLKLLAHPDAASATAVKGVVFAAPSGGALTGAKIGEFNSASFDATLESGQAVLKVPVTGFSGGSLTTSDTPVCVWIGTSAAASPLGNAVAIGSVGPQACTVIEV